MKSHRSKKKNKKVYFYIPFRSQGVNKAYKEFGNGKYEIPDERGLKIFLDKIRQDGGSLKANCIIVNSNKGFLELSCNKNKADKSLNALKKYLGIIWFSKIIRSGRRKNVEAFTQQKE